MTAPPTLSWLACACLLFSGDPDPFVDRDAARKATEVAPERPAFEALYRELRAGDDPFFGRRPLARLREQFETARSRKRRLALLDALAREHLEHGEIERAQAVVDEAFELARTRRDDMAALHRVRALVQLRRAELTNCVERHEAACCIFPLAGGGVHDLPAPALAAARDYAAVLELEPDDLRARWLLNLAHMAVGDYPAGVPPRWLVPPRAFRSEHPLGKFTDVAPKLGVDRFDLCGGAIVEDFTGDGRLDVLTSTSDLSAPLSFFANDGRGGFDDVSKPSRADDQLGGLNCIAADYDSDGDADVVVLRGAWMLDSGRIRNSLLRNDDGVFTDVTAEAGMDLDPRPTQAAAWADFDLDGQLDLYVGNESRLAVRGDGDFPSELYRNRGDGTFAETAGEAGVTNDRYCKGVAVGDYDDDGDPDLYVSNVGANRMYRNDGELRFTDVARELGVEQAHRTFASWFFDYDNDGSLDLFVASFEATVDDVAAEYLGLESDARPPALFRNRGDGTFEDVTVEVGLDRTFLPMGANFGDLDNDGWLDLYLATGDPDYESLMPNVALRNDAGRRFQDVTTATGLGHLQKGHGVAFADIDSDGDQDIYHQLGGFYPGDAFHNALFLNPGNDHGFLVLQLEGRRTNRAAFGARVTVVVRDDAGLRSIHRAVGSVSSFGGSPARQEIGLGDAREIERVEIFWPVTRELQVVEDLPLNAAVRVVEGTDGFERLPYRPVRFE